MHFLPSSAFPPYPDPNDQIVLSSGKWQIDRRSGFRSPTLCKHLVKSTESSDCDPNCPPATPPIRVPIPIDTATYSESLTCTPTFASGLPMGPITNGITYIVRPRIHPVNSSRSFA